MYVTIRNMAYAGNVIHTLYLPGLITTYFYLELNIPSSHRNENKDKLQEILWVCDVEHMN